jgi:chemotaxis receptor (MCP) glutamine deamidase CheD
MGKAEVKLAGMGEIVFARGAGVLGCIGLGSCVGTVLFDPRAHAAALAHVMLPEAQRATPLYCQASTRRPRCPRCCGYWIRRPRSPHA